MEPQKVRIRFNVKLDEVPENCRDVVLKFQEVAEEQLFKWSDDFDLSPPQSFFDCDLKSSNSNSRAASSESGGPLKFESLFVVPDFDEMDTLARDPSTGDLIRLSQQQLEAVRRRGEFDVESKRFPNQRHRWRLNRFFQKGTANTRDSLRKDAIRAMQMLLVTARNRWWGQGFSVRQALKGFWKGFLILTDLFIGLPHTNYGDLNIILQKELQYFLVCELNCKGRFRTQMDECWNFLESVVNMRPEERYDHSVNNLRDLALVAPPFLFITPGKVQLDLRLHSHQVWSHLTPILRTILSTALDGWFYEFRDKMVTELKKNGVPSKEIADTVNKACTVEFYNRVFEMVRNNPTLEETVPGIGETLVRQARFALICEEVDTLFREREEQHVEAVLADFQRRSPILAAMAPKVRALKKEAHASFQEENRFGRCELALQRAIEEKLDQHAYFVSRLLQFWRERVPLLEKRVRATRQIFPDNTFSFKRKLWLPKHWIVHQSNFGITTQVETQVISQPQTWSRSAATQIHYTVHKSRTYRTSTRYPFWRWRNFFIRHFVFMMNVIYYFALAIPFGSGFGVRALFSKEPFYPRYSYDSSTGVISPDPAHKVQSFLSRLIILWHHVRRSRRNFEAAPNTGLIDKGVTRHPNRFWNYVIKGACGTLLIVLLYPLTCLLVTLICIALVITAPIWTLVLSLLYSFFFLNFIYDRNKPCTRRNRFFPFFEATIYHWLIRGVLQMILAALTSIILCPLMALIFFVAGAIRFAVRSTWDAFMFQVMVKRSARVPCKDDWVARRTSGPGLASSHYFKAKPDQVLLSLLAMLEREELNLWYAGKRMQINQPTFRFMEFMRTTMSWFSLTTVYNGVLSDVREQKDKFLQQLADVRLKRASALRSTVSISVLHKMKLTVRDLDAVTKQALPMIESYYDKKLLPFFTGEREVSETEENWWSGRSMRIRDFMALFNSFITMEFGEQILIPLEDSDTFYSLDVQHLDLDSYVSMITDAQPRDDLDEVTHVIKEPKRLSHLLKTPSLSVDQFEPDVPLGLPPAVRSQPFTRRRRRPRNILKPKRIKKKFSNQRKEELRPDSLSSTIETIIPLQMKVYHPAVITLLLHKRDRSDQSAAMPLPLDDVFLREVLASIVSHAAEGLVGTVRSASLNSVDPDLLQSTAAASPLHVPVATMGTPSVATTEDDDDDEEWENEEDCENERAS